MLIDSSYFTKGTRHILNATAPGAALPALPLPGSTPMSDSLAVNTAIEGYIAEFQEQFLKSMLGDHYGNRAHIYLVALDDDPTTPRQESFDAVLDVLRESFAYYVFYHILRDANNQPTVTGLVRLKSANEYVSPIRRQVSAWNAMVDRNNAFLIWATDHSPLKGMTVNANMLTKINQFNL